LLINAAQTGLVSGRFRGRKYYITTKGNGSKMVLSGGSTDIERKNHTGLKSTASGINQVFGIWELKAGNGFCGSGIIKG
jgi:hypothetical protein